MIVVLLLVLIAPHGWAAAQDPASSLPPQCRAAPPTNVSFLGPARSIEAGGVAWSYHRFGNASAGRPPLLLIHGLGGTQYDWPLPVLQSLAGSREVVVFDNQRAGLSNDSSNATLSMPGMAAATVQLVRALELPAPPDVLGFSMGGMIAQQLAANHSADVGTVVAAGGSYGGSAAPQPAGGLADVLETIDRGGPNAIDLVFALGENDTALCGLLQNADSFLFAVTPGYNNDSRAGYALRQGIVPSAAALAVSPEVKEQQTQAILEFYQGQGLLGALRGSETQLLLVNGEHDAVIPPATQTQAAAEVPGVSLLQVPDAGHLVHYYHPLQYAQQLAAFLDGAQAVNEAQAALLDAAAVPARQAGAQAEEPGGQHAQAPPPSGASGPRGKAAALLVAALAALAAVALA